MSRYQQAMATLPADGIAAIQNALNAWVGDADLKQVGQNICDETALALADFVELLRSFVTELATGTSAENSWIAACRAHKRKGPRLSDANSPPVLGRARGLADHADSVAQASNGALTPAEAKRLLLKSAGGLVGRLLDPFLRLAPLGRHLVWATFNPDNPTTDPFDRLPATHVGICAALGLGRADTTLILLAWNHRVCGSPPLHRPTVADAEVYPYYRPYPDPNALWGFTHPLQLNPDALQPQPELVLPETTSQGLLLPFRVVRA
jgi:hypothetical protein